MDIKFGRGPGFNSQSGSFFFLLTRWVMLESWSQTSRIDPGGCLQLLGGAYLFWKYHTIRSHLYQYQSTQLKFGRVVWSLIDPPWPTNTVHSFQSQSFGSYAIFFKSDLNYDTLISLLNEKNNTTSIQKVRKRPCNLKISRMRMAYSVWIYIYEQDDGDFDFTGISWRAASQQ